MAAKTLEGALIPAISTCHTNIAAKASKAEHQQAAQDFVTQTPTKTSRSVGVLRKAKITAKPLSPDLSGNLYLQRNTFDAISKQFETTNQSEVVCKIAAWVYRHEGGSDLTVELSPSYKRKQTPRPDILDSIFNNNEE